MARLYRGLGQLVTVSYDALLVVSFGGPERREDVIPFLENVLRGKPVPRERLLEVAEHYYHFGGVSPINTQTRELIANLRQELDAHGVALPIYWGNRNWHPLLTDTVREMADHGIRRVLAWVTSAYSSYSGCRQYLENIQAACNQVGARAPVIDKVRAFFNHPGFIEAQVDRTRAAWEQIPAAARLRTHVLFTAHSIPVAMAANCRYVEQLTETSRLVAERLGLERTRLVYQSRSGPPGQPWLEPDVGDAIGELHRQDGVPDVVVVPIGFLSDHLEVLYDLDVQTRELCARLGVHMVRAGTVATHRRFVQMIRELFVERLRAEPVHPVVGRLPAAPDVCPDDCCRNLVRPEQVSTIRGS